MEKYSITITGSVREVIPVLNELLEKERKRLRRRGIHFKVERDYISDVPNQPTSNNPDIVSDYL